MRTKQLHLVERAAERLLRDGMLDRPTQEAETPPNPDAEGTSAQFAPAPAPWPSGPAEVPGRPRSRLDAAALRRAGIIDWQQPRSRAADEFRIVQAQVLRAAFDANAALPGTTNVVMVTSTRPGEGKSFTAANLAASVALGSDHTALLVDADPKPGSIGELLGLANITGLLDLAQTPGLDPEQFVVASAIEHLFVLAAGTERLRNGLPATRHLARLIGDLGRSHPDRLVVIDAPPCLSTSDPSTLAPMAGQIIFVVEYERTTRPEIEAALDLVQACPRISLLLNKVEPSSLNGFGAYASKYYP